MRTSASLPRIAITSTESDMSRTGRVDRHAGGAKRAIALVVRLERERHERLVRRVERVRLAAAIEDRGEAGDTAAGCRDDGRRLARRTSGRDAILADNDRLG